MHSCSLTRCRVISQVVHGSSTYPRVLRINAALAPEGSYDCTRAATLVHRV